MNRDLFGNRTYRKSNRNRLAVFAALLPLGLAIAFTSYAQTQAQTQGITIEAHVSKFEYEVASIKPDLSDHTSSSTNNPPDGFSATNATLAVLVQSAYGIPNFQLIGGPDWINSERYVVDAKMDSETADALQKLALEDRLLVRQHMLQVLLADRLKLTIHHDTRELPVYFLVVAKNGSKLHQANPGDTYADGVKGRGNPMGQGVSSSSNRFATSITSQGMPLSRLIPLLARALGRPVLDKTELTGNFDYALKFAVDRPEPDDTLNGRPFPDSDAPFLFEAIQQQLGLKLESGKGPVEVIVIDHIERPSGN
jgi:uncharacterized protein (TIGR03435 family)